MIQQYEIIGFLMHILSVNIAFTLVCQLPPGFKPPCQSIQKPSNEGHQAHCITTTGLCYTRCSSPLLRSHRQHRHGSHRHEENLVHRCIRPHGDGCGVVPGAGGGEQGRRRAGGAAQGPWGPRRQSQELGPELGEPVHVVLCHVRRRQPRHPPVSGLC